MKGKIFVVLGLGLLVCLLSLSAWAQSEDSKTQLYAVWDDTVHPSKFMDYEAASKEWVVFATKYDFPYPTTTYRTDDFHYYTLMPITKLGDIDGVEKYWVEAGKKIGKVFEEDDAKLTKLFAGTCESGTFGILALRRDLSYLPENPRVTSEPADFVLWNYYYIRSGMEKEAEKLSKEWQALFKKSGIADPYNVFQAVMWSDMPVSVSAMSGTNAADFFSRNADNIAKMGDAYNLMVKKTMDMCRRFERKMGTVLRECSYVPTKK